MALELIIQPLLSVCSSVDCISRVMSIDLEVADIYRSFNLRPRLRAARVPLTEDRESLEFPTFWVDVNVLVGSESVEVNA